MRIKTRRGSLLLLSFSLKATPFTILTLAAKAYENDEYEETQRDTNQKAKQKLIRVCLCWYLATE